MNLSKIVLGIFSTLLCSAVNAGVIGSISTSASGTGDGSFITDYTYGYLFTIEQDDTDNSIYMRP